MSKETEYITIDNVINYYLNVWSYSVEAIQENK